MKFCRLSWDSKQYEPFSHISAAVGCFLFIYSFIFSGEMFEPIQKKGRIRFNIMGFFSQEETQQSSHPSISAEMLS